MDVAVAIYRVTRDFPKHEQYGLISQMQRAAVSIPANIAEGHARSSTKDYLRFLAIAQGSIAELETQLLLARRLEYGDPESQSEVLASLDEVGRMLRGLQLALKRKLPRK